MLEPGGSVKRCMKHGCGCSSEGNMLSLIGKPREQQLEELDAWTVRDMRAALNRQEVKNIGANTRVNLIPKMMVRCLLQLLPTAESTTQCCSQSPDVEGTTVACMC